MGSCIYCIKYMYVLCERADKTGLKQKSSKMCKCHNDVGFWGGYRKRLSLVSSVSPNRQHGYSINTY